MSVEFNETNGMSNMKDIVDIGPKGTVDIDIPILELRAVNKSHELYLSKTDLMLWLTEFAEATDNGGASWIVGDTVRKVRDVIKSTK